MSSKPTGENKVPASALDLRVRARNLRSGVLDPKALEAHLAGLIDVQDAADVVTLAQPALASEHDDDDDDDDDDSED